MLSIGEFATLGGASARMLRHYDALGLLVPDGVDPYTGRRHYRATQLPRLNRLLALKALGFSLSEIAGMLGEQPPSGGVERLLLRRQAELERQIAGDQHLLRRVQARLRLIQEASVSIENRVKVAELRLVGLSGETNGVTRQHLGAKVQELFGQVVGFMDAAGADRTSPMARYQFMDSGECRIFAGYLLAEGVVAGLETESWPAVEIASIVHHGPMSELAGAYQVLAQRVAEPGESADFPAATWRESYLEAAGEDQSDWIVEVQMELPVSELP